MAKHGFQCKLYYCLAPLTAADHTGATWIELGIIKDLDYEDTFDKSEDTARANNGKKVYDLGLEDESLSFTLQFRPADVDFQAIRDAKTAREEVAFAEVDDDIATIGTTGIAGNWKIAKFAMGKPVGGIVDVKVELIPTGFVHEVVVIV